MSAEAIPKAVVDAMLDEVQSTMQAQINALMQKATTYRAAMKQLELHGTSLEQKVAEQAAEIDRLTVLVREVDPDATE